MHQKESVLIRFARTLNRIGNAVMMNLLFLLSCVPIVTVGQAWCGLLGAVRCHARGEKWFEGFRTGFCGGFWRGTVCWCAGLAVCMFFLSDVNSAIIMGLDVGFSGVVAPLIAAAALFALSSMVVSALLLLNAAVPTGVSPWLQGGASLVFKAPLQLLASTLLLWLPALVLLLWDGMILIQLMLVLLCAYFVIAALVSDMLMKKTLQSAYRAAMADGTLTDRNGIITEEDESNA